MGKKRIDTATGKSNNIQSDFDKQVSKLHQSDIDKGFAVDREKIDEESSYTTESYQGIENYYPSKPMDFYDP